tara:strand:+ start:1074 stop:1283 length:210 start_codon:yes stop_codon:yes gene_type:complete
MSNQDKELAAMPEEINRLADPSITFNLGDEIVLVINAEGLTYRGELAADAGQCYAMMREFLNRAKGQHQ